VSSLMVRPTLTSTPGNSGTMHHIMITCSELLCKAPYSPLATFLYSECVSQEGVWPTTSECVPYIMIVVCFGRELIVLASLVTKWCVGLLYSSTSISKSWTRM
jgi:hypothetical protein